MRIEEILVKVPSDVRNQLHSFIEEKENELENARKREESYWQALESITEPVHVVDTNLKFTLFNKSFMRWNKELGLETAVIGKKINEVFPFLPDNVIDEYTKVINTQEPIVTEELTRIENDEFITKTQKIPILSYSEGKVSHIITMVSNLTGYKQTEKAFFETYKMLFESSPDIITLVDPTGRIIDCNQAFENIIGLSKEKIIGSLFTEIGIVPEEKILEYSDRFVEVVNGSRNGPFEAEVVNATGEICVFEIFTARIMRNNEIYAIQVICHDITERKRTEDALRESEEKYRNLVEKMEEGVLLEDAKGIISFVNPRTAEMLGYNKTELLGKHWTYIVPKKELFKTTRESKKRPHGISSTYESVLQAKGGSHIPVIITSSPIISDNNKFKGVLSVFTDITERKIMEEALRESERQYRSLFENIPIGLFRCTLNGEFLAANPAFLEKLGFSSFEELIEIKPEKIAIQRGYPRDLFLKEIEEKGEVRGFENRFKRPDGSTIYIRENARVIKDSDGPILYYEGSLEDITDRKLAEEALREAKEKYQMLVEKMEEGVALEDTEGIITFVNPKTVNLLGYTEDDLVGKHWSIIVSEEFHSKHESEGRKRSNGISSTYESILLAKDGTRIPVIITATPIFSTAKEFEGVLVVITDITERKQVEEVKEELADRQREFMDQTAHELRTPLTIIKGYTEFLLRKEHDVEKIRVLNIILRNIGRLEELGSSVGDIYRIERGSFSVNLEKMEFHEFLLSYIEPYLKLYRDQLVYDDSLATNKVFIRGDSKRLVNVLNNILDNSIRNTSNESRKIILTMGIINNQVQLKIIDNGVGVNPDNLERIFEKFVSIPTKYDVTGTGIGLYISREIIKAHDGTIFAYSEGEDKGTTITINLPLFENHSAS
ncbi:MAG: PAS domain S-box protein [Candidatus Hodarchaeota archaeon]